MGRTISTSENRIYDYTVAPQSSVVDDQDLLRGSQRTLSRCDSADVFVDLGEQRARTDRLGEIGVTACFRRAAFLAVQGIGRDRDHRDVPERGFWPPLDQGLRRFSLIEPYSITVDG